MLTSSLARTYKKKKEQKINIFNSLERETTTMGENVEKRELSPLVVTTIISSHSFHSILGLQYEKLMMISTDVDLSA
jgi:hypothetical protein